MESKSRQDLYINIYEEPTVKMHAQGQSQQTQQHSSTHPLLQQQPQNHLSNNNAVGKPSENQSLSSVGKRIDYKLLKLYISTYVHMYLLTHLCVIINISRLMHTRRKKNSGKFH